MQRWRIEKTREIMKNPHFLLNSIDAWEKKKELLDIARARKKKKMQKELHEYPEVLYVLCFVHEITESNEKDE